MPLHLFPFREESAGFLAAALEAVEDAHDAELAGEAIAAREAGGQPHGIPRT